MSTLAVDVGGTRIKWALLADDGRGDGPLGKSGSMRTLGWLNHSLPDLFDPSRSDSITRPSCLDGSFQRVAVSLCGEVDVTGQRVGDDLTVRGVPRDLADRISQRLSGAKVQLVNDGEAWFRGAERLLTSSNSTALQYPLLTLIFGTGVACCYGDEPRQPKPLDLSTAFPATRLRMACADAGQPSPQTDSVHFLLGNRFFRWIEQCRLDWNRGKVGAELLLRVSALLQDFAAAGLHPATVLIGGGHADVLSNQRLDGVSSASMLLLDSHQPAGVDASSIPLLGAVLAADARR